MKHSQHQFHSSSENKQPNKLVAMGANFGGGEAQPLILSSTMKNSTKSGSGMRCAGATSFTRGQAITAEDCETGVSQADFPDKTTNNTR